MIQTEIFKKQPTDISHHLTKLTEIFDYLEFFLKENNYMAGNQVS